jgi:hypothetical protein
MTELTELVFFFNNLQRNFERNHHGTDGTDVRAPIRLVPWLHCWFQCN